MLHLLTMLRPRPCTSMRTWAQQQLLLRESQLLEQRPVARPSTRLQLRGNLRQRLFDEAHLKDPGNAMGRYSDANEVAEVIEFLCSERNTYSTGAVWSVKGAAG